LVWLASARPNLEYGSEVWTPTPAEARALDAAQTHAGVLCFALNRKANAHAVRSLMHVPSLGLRRTRSKLIYLVKLKCMEDDRLVRRLAGGVAGSKLRWSKKILAVIEDDKELRKAYERIQQSAVRNGNVLPQGPDLTLHDQEGQELD
jgi:hypothetical protein